MIKSKLFDVLKSFSKEDMKRFGDYLNSPFFNKRKLISDLFNVYRKFYPAFSDKSFTKEKVFKKIFPDKKFSDEVFRNLNSILHSHAEDFLSIINYSGNSLVMKQHLLSEINHRNILPVFKKNFDESLEMLESSVHKDLKYFYSGFSLFQNKDLYNSMINRFSKEDIIASEKNLVIFFVMQLLEIQNYILFECRILDLDDSLYLDKGFTEKLLKALPKEITELPQIRIYYNAWMLELSSEKKYYDNLRSLINSHGHLIEKEKHYNKYLDMIHYLKRTSSTQDIETVKELFHLRKEIVEKGLFMENTITNIFFMNLVRSAIRLNELEWAANFISQYQTLLIPRYREITAYLALAFLHFEKREFGEALSYAARVKYEDSYYSLEVKNLTARIYYEMKDYELLQNFISSYRMYLSKNRTLGKNEIGSHGTFLKFLDKLLKISEQKKLYKTDALEEQVRKADFINKPWILEKIEELAN